MVLVQGTHGGRPHAEFAGSFELAARQVAECRLVEDGLSGRRQPTSLREQPGLEGSRVLSVQAVEQLRSETWEVDGVTPVAVGEDVDIHLGAGG